MIMNLKVLPLNINCHCSGVHSLFVLRGCLCSDKRTTNMLKSFPVTVSRCLAFRCPSSQQQQNESLLNKRTKKDLKHWGDAVTVVNVESGLTALLDWNV